MEAHHLTGNTARHSVLYVICALMAIDAASFVAASIIHFGTVIAFGPLTFKDPFPGAAIPEASIAVALSLGILSALVRWPGRWWGALAASLYALLLTIYGLSVTVRSPRSNDIIYHVAVLAFSAVIVALLLMPRSRRSLVWVVGASRRRWILSPWAKVQ
jgi:hypothetical protein